MPDDRIEVARFLPAPRLPEDRPGGAGCWLAGWLMSYVYDAARDTSDLVVLDTAGLAAEPVATIHLPRRVPVGFPGNWLPDPPAAG